MNRSITLLLFACCLAFAGCPLPAKYIQRNQGGSIQQALTNDSCLLSITLAYPWRDTKHKVIIVYTRIRNQASTPRTFVCSQVSLHSPADQYALNLTNASLVNAYVVKQDTVPLQPGEQREVALYFLSAANYTHRQYKQSIKSDTLTLTMQGSNEPIRLMGKWH